MGTFFHDFFQFSDATLIYLIASRVFGKKSHEIRIKKFVNLHWYEKCKQILTTFLKDSGFPKAKYYAVLSSFGG